MRVKINVTGIVQGVGFRPFIYRLAVKNNLAGYVLNRGDAGVEILLEGEDQSIGSFLRDLKQKKPHLAQIDAIKSTELSGKKEYDNFSIYKSSEEAELSGSIIPPDIAICNECLAELRDQKTPDMSTSLLHAQIVAHASQSSSGCHTTAKTLPCVTFHFVVSV